MNILLNREEFKTEDDISEDVQDENIMIKNIKEGLDTIKFKQKRAEKNQLKKKSTLSVKSILGKAIADKHLEKANNSCLIDPNNTYKLHWDIFMTVLLLYSCVVTPL